jgi:dolichol kinase
VKCSRNLSNGSSISGIITVAISSFFACVYFARLMDRNPAEASR